MYSQISVVTFGAIDNSFTLAASWAITNNDDINNYLIIAFVNKKLSHSANKKVSQF